MEVETILRQLEAQANADNRAGMARYGINIEKAYGVNLPFLRGLAKSIGRNHALALALWNSGFHEARILATLIDDRKQVSDAQMESWVLDFNSWDLCDQCCSNLFRWTPFAYDKAVAWSARDETFVKRAGFVLMAVLASGDKRAPDESFAAFLSIIQREAGDERNFVKKAVNWALRGIGKRSRRLNALAVETARAIQQMNSKAARWVAADALRELTSEKTTSRLKA